MMRAVVITRPGGPEVLEIRSLPEPTPSAGEVRVAVKAAGLNRADILQRKGHYPAPPDAPRDVPGLEYAGVVEALGPGCSSLEVGDAVMGIVGGGGFSETLVVHERTAIRVPNGLDLIQAAAIPEAFLTAFDALHLQAELATGERVLVHAVGSGVGTAAVQLARLVQAIPFGTARTQEKLDKARALGLDHALLTPEPRFADWAKAESGGAGVDVVLDLVGAAYFEENVKALALKGRLIGVGLVAGATATISLGTLLAKRLTIRGTVLRARPLEEKIALAQLFGKLVTPAFVSGALRPVVDRAMPMEAIQEAHRYLEANESFGKVVMTW